MKTAVIPNTFTTMLTTLIAAATFCITGCQSVPVARTGTAPTSLPANINLFFHDAAFAPPLAPIRVDEIFALSPEMRQYITSEIAPEIGRKGRANALFDALYESSKLKLSYDAARTRSAAEAFSSRSGNCLSLVIMTAAIARELSLPVRYQSVRVEETWSRTNDLLFASGHVNLTLGVVPGAERVAQADSHTMTIDFVQPQGVRLRDRVIDEATVVAMYLNNRAAEILAQGDTDEAYWWAREALESKPNFAAALNTLGVIYRRHGNPDEAERVFRRLLKDDAGNLEAMSNLALALHDQGRVTESAQMAAVVERLRPFPPFHFFNLGMAAMKRGDTQTARDYFRQEVERASYNPEFHFWLGSAHAKLGETSLAARHLALAIENSNTRNDRDIYAAKLQRIKSSRF